MTWATREECMQCRHWEIQKNNECVWVIALAFTPAVREMCIKMDNKKETQASHTPRNMRIKEVIIWKPIRWFDANDYEMLAKFPRFTSFMQ